MTTNNLQTGQEKFRPLETLVSKELEINDRVNSEREGVVKSVSEVLDYTKEEIENIDNLMKIVEEIDDLISSGKTILNCFVYRKFMISYNSLNEREKKYFTKIYKGFKVIYYFYKISENIKKGGLSKVANITKYINEFRSENFDDEYILKFWSLFDEKERSFLEEHFEQK